MARRLTEQRLHILNCIEADARYAREAALNHEDGDLRRHTATLYRDVNALSEVQAKIDQKERARG